MKEWFISRNQKKYGPYTTGEIIQLRQNGKCFEGDLVWKNGLRQWKTLVTTDEFLPLAMAEQTKRQETCALFNRRQWERTRKEVNLVAHNEELLWQGRSISLSQGGALIEITSPSLKPGDKIHLHFQTSEGSHSSFSCLAVVTGKRFINERMRFNTAIQYVVRFEEKDEGADIQLADWVRNNVNENINTSKGVSHVTTNR